LSDLRSGARQRYPGRFLIRRVRQSGCGCKLELDVVEHVPAICLPVYRLIGFLVANSAASALIENDLSLAELGVERGLSELLISVFC
jgi:hypothetical protein